PFLPPRNRHALGPSNSQEHIQAPPGPGELRLIPALRMELLHHVTSNKTVSVLQQLERDHARTVGYSEPMTMILDHLAFSRKLSARAVAASGGSSQAFSDDLS